MVSHERGGRAPSATPPPPITPQDAARYTREMLVSLRRIAIGNGHFRLAHLLELAVVEAKYLADQAQDT
jgi:hypothetical protein